MKNYFIVGASSGIGQALAEILRERGDSVYFTYNSNVIGDSELSQKLDVLTDTIDLTTLPDRLDGFVYCPGSIDLRPFARLKREDILEDFRLQVLGAIETLQQVLPRLKAAEQSSVVFFSTVAVQTGFNFHSQVAVAKGAIEGLTRSLAAEFAPIIRVNAIAPSLTDTPLAARLLSSNQKKEANAERHPLKRIGDATDIAEMAAFLLSDKSSWISGQIIAVDGGMSSIRQ